MISTVEKRKEIVNKYKEEIKRLEEDIKNLEEEYQEICKEYPDPTNLPYSVSKRRRNVKEKLRVKRSFIRDASLRIERLTKELEGDFNFKRDNFKAVSGRINKKYADELVKFEGRILGIVLPKTRKQIPNDFIVELSLCSTESISYTDMHKWISDNRKSINAFVKKVLFDKYGAQINAFKCYDIVHTRDSMLRYSFEIKPELLKQIKEVINDGQK